MSTRVSRPARSKKLSCCVRPGVCEVRASVLRPVSALTRLDLPTFERPAKAISRPPIGGSPSMRLAPQMNSASPAKSLRPGSRYGSRAGGAAGVMARAIGGHARFGKESAMPASGNLFAHIPDRADEEEVTELLAAPDLRIERIVSTGQASPPGFWYDQDWDEWVVVLSGTAELRLEEEAEPRRLRRGDYLHLPARARHRVAWTDPGEPTVWLAIH